MARFPWSIILKFYIFIYDRACRPGFWWVYVWSLKRRRPQVVTCGCRWPQVAVWSSKTAQEGAIGLWGIALAFVSLMFGESDHSLRQKNDKNAADPAQLRHAVPPPITAPVITLILGQSLVLAAIAAVCRCGVFSYTALAKGSRSELCFTCLGWHRNTE